MQGFKQQWLFFYSGLCENTVKHQALSLSIKEGMHIGWQKPALNKNIDFLACSISVQVSMVINQTMIKIHIDEYNPFWTIFSDWLF